MMASLKIMPKVVKAANDEGMHPHIPAKYIKREVVKGSLAPIGRFGSPAPTRTNTSTLHLFGPGLAEFADWQVGPAVVPKTRPVQVLSRSGRIISHDLGGLAACCPGTPATASCTCMSRGCQPPSVGRLSPMPMSSTCSGESVACIGACLPTSMRAAL